MTLHQSRKEAISNAMDSLERALMDYEDDEAIDAFGEFESRLNSILKDGCQAIAELISK